MTPYYDDGRGIQIFHGDCRDVLPTLAAGSVDLVLTDPPYGVNWQSGRKNGNKFLNIAGDDGSLGLTDILIEAIRPLPASAHLYVFGPADMREDYVDWSRLDVSALTPLVWDKGMMGLGNIEIPWGLAHETIWFAVRSRPNEKHSGKGATVARMRRASVLRFNRLSGDHQVNRHPTEKPIMLLRELIEASSQFSDVVLDPFMGSGSTLVAAQLEGRRAIGIEIDENYCRIAAERLAQQRLPFAAAV